MTTYRISNYTKGSKLECMFNEQLPSTYTKRSKLHIKCMFNEQLGLIVSAIGFQLLTG